MKALKGLFLAMIIVPAILAFTSCSKDMTSSPVASEADNTDFSIITPSSTASDIQVATIDNEMLMIPPVDGIFIQGGNLLRIDLSFARIFRQLKLTADQRTQIPPFLKEYNSCVRTAMVALRASEKAIVDSANAHRRVIMQEFKDSLITRDSAKTLLQQLNKDTRAALKANPARVTACEAMKACRDAFFAEIRGILTSDQQTIWDAWVAKLPVIDCSKQN